MNMPDCCIHEDRWREHSGRLERVEGNVSAIKHRLFEDNSSPSIQTRLDRVERVVRVAAWVAGTAATGTIGQIAAAVFQHFVKGAP
jgi:hypothetical protein